MHTTHAGPNGMLPCCARRQLCALLCYSGLKHLETINLRRERAQGKLKTFSQISKERERVREKEKKKERKIHKSNEVIYTRIDAAESIRQKGSRENRHLMDC